MGPPEARLKQPRRNRPPFFSFIPPEPTGIAPAEKRPEGLRRSGPYCAHICGGYRRHPFIYRNMVDEIFFRRFQQQFPRFGMGQVLSVPERCVCPSSAQNGAMAGSVDLCVGSHIDAFSGSRDPVYGVCDLLQSWNGNVRKAAAFNCKRAKLHVQPLRRVRLRKNYRRTTSRTELLRAACAVMIGVRMRKRMPQTAS